MSTIENPILLPILRTLVGTLIGKENLQLFDTVDWRDTSEFEYPEYYTSKNFHGITGGYLNAIAPVTYDAVTRFAAPPNETKQREKAIAAIKHKPQHILDLGCGTGSSTLMLKQAYPRAEVTGLDLSPYMLKIAEHKGKQADLNINWQQGLAEATNFENAAFDLISIAFLFHETPIEISQSVLKECHRLLKPKGQIVILDGNQQRLRHTPWLIELFREPYSQVYAEGWINDWLKSAGFVEIQTNPIGWVSQLSTGFKQQTS